MESQRPGEEPSSSGPDAFSGSLFPLPTGYRLEQYTIQAMIGATAEEVTYLAADDAAREDAVVIQEYFPDDVVMRLSDQSVSSILEADEQKLQDGVVRFMQRSAEDGTAAGRGRVSRVFEANNTAYRVIEPSRQVSRAPVAGGGSPWRYFAIGAGSALALVVLGVGGYLVTGGSKGRPAPSLAAAPAATAPSPPPTPASTTSSSMPATTLPPMPTTTLPSAAPSTVSSAAPTPVAPPAVRGTGAALGADRPRDAVQHAPSKSSAHQRPRIELSGKKAKSDAARAEARNPTTFLILDIEPEGRIYVDGKMVGSSPPLTRVPVTPGRHRVEIHGYLPPGIYYYRVNLRPGESQPLTARFE